MHLLFLVFRQKLQGQERFQSGSTLRSSVHLDKSNPASMAGKLDRTCRRGVQGVQINQVYWPRHEDWDQTWDMRLASRIRSQSYRCTSSHLSCTTPHKTQRHEIISGIFQTVDFETLKAFHRVCLRRYRVATNFLFCRVRTDGGLLDLIRPDRSLRQLTVRPTIAVVHQVHRRRFTTALTGMDSRDSPILPALQGIRLIANEPPCLSLPLFTGLRNLQINMETVRLPEGLTWKSLTDLSLRAYRDIALSNGV
ncbi:hypothetical protein BDQ94DRAFT_164249 [Aspergillus welwitschiae]|uniref:F-box domain-containing protein n=1 Tax=Aspergillus welwitschiae TaxID=1341132 RepID=A0A3F3PIG2_9EURO|nr:hypothetical protein BDQ94DRAFT_164249 [Aspergillus welwitschiae]RDH26721.1 hypothetical protein BDQ94DRAFT_164249 [Aspergillus welwitschiae]